MSDIKVLFLTKYDRKGASSRYRFLQYIPHLEGEGFSCSYKPLFSNEYLKELYNSGNRPLLGVIKSYIRRTRDLLRVRNFDILVIEKELFPYAPASFERLLGRTDTPYIVDYDDAVFHNYDRSENPVVRRLLGGKIDTVMREAETVIAGNEYLASKARKAGAPQVEIIPTVIDLSRYPYVPPGSEEPFTVGWIGSPATAQYVEGIAPALRKFCNKYNARVVLVGSGNVELPGVPYEERKWSEATEIDDITEFDVGIMPLKDTPWERGKCGFKLIQYMACGKPVVASPVGVNTEVVEDEYNGLHAVSHGEWIDSLSRIYEDPNLAKSMGKRGRQRVEEKYCLDVTVPKWLSVLRAVYN